MSGRRVALAAGAVAVVTVAAVVLLDRSADDTTAAASDVALATAAVVRRDLAETDTFDGTLGYASTAPVVNRLEGTITALSPEGSLVKRGQALYRVDGAPVTLMYGTVPAYRRLAEGVEDGADVRQLEWNLVALGYDTSREITIDDEFGSATTAAVLRWQEDAGLVEDGAVDLGEVVFLSGPRRVGEHSATVGLPAAPAAVVMSTASTTQVVTVDLEATRQELVNEGDAVRVELPGGAEVAGTIERVGTIAEQASGEDPELGQGEPTIEVTIRLAGRAGTDLDRAPVDVRVTRNLEQDVLAVPVTALLALAGGGYGVELAGGDGQARLVGVETGVYADGYVQVSGDGIAEGARVVVPE